METLFNSEDQITEEWINYLALEAAALAENSDEYIDRYMNRELENPLFIDFLDHEESEKILINFKEEEIENLNFSLAETLLINHRFRVRLPKFRKLKRAIKKVFCDVVKVQVDGGIKDIIKAVLLGLIPVLGGGIAPVLLPFVVGYIAKLLKNGADAVCN